MQDLQAPGWDQMKLEFLALRLERVHPQILDANLKHLQKMMKVNAWHESCRKKSILPKLMNARSQPTPQHLEEPRRKAWKPQPRPTANSQIGPHTTWEGRSVFFSHGTSAQ